MDDDPIILNNLWTPHFDSLECVSHSIGELDF